MTSNMTDKSNRDLISLLIKSALYQEYERAFCQTTGMPLAFRPLEFWQVAHQGHERQNGFCKMLAGDNGTCSGCLVAQKELCDRAVDHPVTIRCPMGLFETAVPVKIGEQTIGYLQTGQVRQGTNGQSGFGKAAKRLTRLDADIDSREAREKFLQTPVWDKHKYMSVVSLLKLFAQHVALLANSIVLQRDPEEHPIVARARRFIAENYMEDISLGDVASHCGVNLFYLCKLLKARQGVTFTEILTRTRIEQAKNKLHSQHARISCTAYEVGFQSLTHFNRVFKRTVGYSPSAYRDSLAVTGTA